MRDTTIRRGLVATALLPALAAGLLVRPAPADGGEVAFGLYALTVAGSAITTEGEAGAGGGLAVIDAGAPAVVGRLDSSPSATILAAPVEPGTLFRTVAGLVNNEAGPGTIPVPTATSSYPGGAAEDRVDGSGEQTIGPYTTTAYHARTTAGQLDITGSAEANRQRLVGDDPATTASASILRDGLIGLAAAYPTAGFAVADEDATYLADGGRVTATASADPSAGTLTATVTSVSGRVTVLGQIGFGSVTGTATVALSEGDRTAEAATSVASTTIAGVPVTVGSDGVAVDGTELLPGQTFPELNAQLNALLEQAGVTLQPLEPIEESGDGFAQADSGGIRVTVATAPNPQVPGNDLTLILGQASVSLSDEPPFASVDPITGSDGDAPTGSGGLTTPSGSGSGGLGFGSTTVPAAGVSTPGGGADAPEVAPPELRADEDPEMVRVAGRRMSRRTALAAFGGWQLLSLSICTLAALTMRRRDPEVVW